MLEKLKQLLKTLHGKRKRVGGSSEGARKANREINIKPTLVDRTLTPPGMHPSKRECVWLFVSTWLSLVVERCYKYQLIYNLLSFLSGYCSSEVVCFYFETIKTTLFETWLCAAKTVHLFNHAHADFPDKHVHRLFLALYNFSSHQCQTFLSYFSCLKKC